MIALALAVISVAVASPAPNLATARLLVDAVERVGARCLDGSPVRYWIQHASGTNSTKWSFHHMGGGWCESIEDCARRAYGSTFDGDNCYIGSSNTSCFNGGARNPDGSSNFSETMDFRNIPSCQGARWCGGLMMNDATKNPLSHDWNKVLIPYCDGGSFAGDNDTVTYTELRNITRPLYFRGFRNLNAVIDDLLEHDDLADATHVLVSGDSAGGLATFWHADHWQMRLPTAKVVAAPDSGFFFNNPEYPSWSDSLRWVVEFMNASAGLDRSCTQVVASATGDPLLCRFPEITAAHVDVPLFVMQGRFDHTMDAIVGGVRAGSAAANATIGRIGDRVLDLVTQHVLAKPANAAFITSCEMHCGQWAQEQEPVAGSQAPEDFNVIIDGWTATHALDAWYRGLNSGSAESSRGRLWLQEANFPCETCCHRGQSTHHTIV